MSHVINDFTLKGHLGFSIMP